MAKTGRLIATLDVVATLVVIGTMAVIAWPRIRPLPTAEESPLVGREVRVAGAASKGETAARVAVIEYSDFECPFCGKSALELGPAIDQAYVATGKVLRVFKHVPLFKIHKSAMLAARATECARADEKFWPLHETFFANQDKLSDRGFLERSGQGLGLGESWLSCATAADHPLVASQMKEAEALGINSTPTFLIGVRNDDQVSIKTVILGVRPVADFARAIDAVLADTK